MVKLIKSLLPNWFFNLVHHYVTSACSTCVYIYIIFAGSVAAKSKWKSVKDSYRVQKKKMIAEQQSGGGAVKSSKWPYFEMLSFLDPYMTTGQYVASSVIVTSFLRNYLTFFFTVSHVSEHAAIMHRQCLKLLWMWQIHILNMSSR